MNAPSRPRVCVFAGPSLSAAEIRAAFAAIDVDLQVLPPVQQGDVLRLIDRLPDVIGVIDGAFFHAPSVLHRELLLALERGARVLGSSSMGALRAAELDRFGMEGIGEIYRLYRRGTIDGDDEVAVLHAAQDDGFRPLTEALVNVRHNLSRARRRGIVSVDTAAKVLAHAKRLPFMQRTYPAILGAASRAARLALDGFLRREAVDLKREDALLLARTIVARIDGAEPWPGRIALEVRRTSLLHRYERQYVGHQVGDQHVPDDVTLAFQQLLLPAFPALYRGVSLRCLALDEAAHRGLASDGARAVAAFRRSRRLRSDPVYRAWLRRRLMSDDDLLQLLRERELEKHVLDLYRSRRPPARGRTALLRRMARDVAARYGIETSALERPLLMHPGVPWTGPLIRELKSRGAFARAVEVAARILRHNTRVFERHPRLARAPVRRGLLNEFVAARWGVDPAELDASIRQRGFADHRDFVAAARHLYVYEKTRRASTARDWEAVSSCFVHP